MLATHVSNHDRLVVHVEPCHDLIEHAEGFACVCGPRVQVCGDGWMVTPVLARDCEAGHEREVG